MHNLNEQVELLRKAFETEVKVIQEGGYNYVFIRGLKMPPGCTPSETDVLFCPTPHPSAGYETRLFFRDKVSHPAHYVSGPNGRNFPNWLGTQLILDANWYNFSYTGVKSGTYPEMIRNHLRGLYIQ